jgi:hypothetical protein
MWNKSFVLPGKKKERLLLTIYPLRTEKPKIAPSYTLLVLAKEEFSDARC